MDKHPPGVFLAIHFIEVSPPPLLKAPQANKQKLQLEPCQRPGVVERVSGFSPGIVRKQKMQQAGHQRIDGLLEWITARLCAFESGQLAGWKP
jgi:hypothetical protein